MLIVQCSGGQNQSEVCLTVLHNQQLEEYPAVNKDIPGYSFPSQWSVVFSQVMSTFGLRREE